ncbi:hypothetical protein FIBSPDRAFT_896901 [Athelia psychrophila]|uniref:Uncharacterized protein n=1 Tax=Athelia psychrophila TaxID=1759441 RepID=A0A166CW78_9AGAM|nr:hypothetical protein FIBSPDRAFT_896901 [Fibularhizoctonia sp. CBS 109695]
MDEEQAPPAPPAPPPRTPQAFVPLDGWSAESIAVAQQLYKQVHTQVNANLVDAFGEEIQRLQDYSAALESTFNDLNADYAKEFAAQVQQTDDVLSGAEEFATAIGNAVLFEMFSSDTTKILWSQGFLTGTAAMWSSNITHSLSFNPASYNFDTWIASFRTMFCSRDCAADTCKALHSLSMGNQLISVYFEMDKQQLQLQSNQSISAYCNEAKAFILDLAPGDRSSNLVLDCSKAGLSVVASGPGHLNS